MTHAPSASSTSPNHTNATQHIPRRSALPNESTIRQPKTSARNLKQQLLSTVLPLTLIPLTIGGMVSYTLVDRRTQTAIANSLRGQAVLASETVHQTIQQDQRVIEALSKNPLLLEKAKQGARFAQANRLSQIPEATLEARYILNKQIEPNQALNRYLAQVAAVEDFAEIIVTDANGYNVAYSSLTSDFVQAGEDWWEQAKIDGSWMGDPSYDDVNFNLGFDLSRPVIDPSNGDFLGVIKLFVKSSEFEILNSYLEKADIQGSQQVQLLDTSANFVIARFDVNGQETALTLQSLQLAGGDVVSQLSRQLVASYQSEERPANEAIRRALNDAFPVRNLSIRSANPTPETDWVSTLLTANFDYDGKKYTVSVVPSLDWVSVASMDLSEVRAAGRQNLLVFSLLTLTLAAIAAVWATRLSGQLSAPLDELADKALQVSEGNLEVTAEPKGSLEAQTLANTFNGLVTRVRGFLQEQTLNARQAKALAEVTGAVVVDSNDLPALFQQVVDECRSIIGADRVVVYRFLPDWSGDIAAESVKADLPSALDQDLNDPCIPAETRAKYISEGSFLETNVEKADLHPEHLALLQTLNVKSILSVPFQSQGNLSGLVIAHHCDRIHQWQDREVAFMKQLGLQLGLVVERVTLLEQTRSLAAEQQELKEGLQKSALKLLMDVDPIRAGDLTVRAQVTEDEIGTIADSYNATITSLRKIVLQVQEAAQQVANTTDVNQISIRQLSTSAAQQAADIIATLEKVRDMDTSVRLVATNAEKAEQAVRQASATVTQGDDAMNRTVEGIMAIRETVADTAKKVKRLGESSQKISNVVNLISGFAAQTNMLALNASIEASRAGEGGKGFAVVAEEVRELARQSAEATTEIEKLVASIQAETNAVAAAMEAGTEQVVTGTQLVEETRSSLNQITTVSRQISELVEAIAAATVTQSQASAVVTDTMNSVATTASQNSDAAGQVSESFEQLRSVAQALQEEVSRFRVS
jgi:methyl-accepting chemotaxis protein PixJ